MNTYGRIKTIPCNHYFGLCYGDIGNSIDTVKVNLDFRNIVPIKTIKTPLLNMNKDFKRTVKINYENNKRLGV